MRFRFLGLDSTDKLDDDFTLHEVNKFILSMKNNKATGYDGISAEAWMMMGSRGVGQAISWSSCYQVATLVARGGL
jgi:hypothetical protein